MQAVRTRLWWMEVARGVITIAFAILLFLDRSYTPRILIYGLGIYLLVDGVMDMYKVAKGKREAKHKVLDYGAATISILTGLLSLAVPRITIYLLIAIIAIRIIVRGAKVILEAVRSHSCYAGLSWLYGSVLILVGIFLLVFPTFAFFLLILFLSFYAFCDGLYMLVRGLNLRFRPSAFAASASQNGERLLDIPDTLPPTTRRAVVFVRRTGANGLGHIAWAFEWQNGWFNAGSVENTTAKPIAKPAEMEFWSVHTLDPVAAMQKQKYPYDEYKIFYISNPSPKDAWKTVVWESREPYSILHHNCNDVAYDVLRAYGVVELLDPATEHIPTDWYDALLGQSFPIAHYPVIPVHLHRMSVRELIAQEIVLTIPPHVLGIPPAWRTKGWRAWAEITLAWDKMLSDVRVLFVSLGKMAMKR